jgi:hypothetical protein
VTGLPYGSEFALRGRLETDVFGEDWGTNKEVKEILGRNVVGEVLDEEGSTRAISQVAILQKVCERVPVDLGVDL